MMLMLCVMHWTRVVWVTSKLKLLRKLPELNYTYVGAIDAFFLIFFAYGMLFTTRRLAKFSHRNIMLIINFILQGVLVILLTLIFLTDLSAISILPIVFILLPISQGICYVIILLNLQKAIDDVNKNLDFLNIIMSLWHSVTCIGHILGFSIGLLLTRGIFDLNSLERYAIPLFLNGGFIFLTAIILAIFYRDPPVVNNAYIPPAELLNNSKESPNLNLSPNISSLLSIEKSVRENRDISESSCHSRYSRYSRDDGRYVFVQRPLKDETSWILKNILKYSLNFSGAKSLYWGILMWGAVFLNLKNKDGEVWLGNMCMILYESGQIIMALLLSLKRLEYRKTLMIYPLTLLFASMGLMFLFITDPNHWIYYIVFLIVGGFFGMIYITIAEIICEGLIVESDSTVSLKGMKKTALGIDIFVNIDTGVMVFIMNFCLSYLMIGFCIISVILMIYSAIVCYKEYHKKDRFSERSSNNYFDNSSL